MSRRFISLAVLVLVAVFAIAACDSGESEGSAGAYTVTPEEAVKLIEAGERTVIDVRTPAEYAQSHVVGAINMDVDGAEFSDRVAELDADEPLLLYCRSGRRSAIAAAQMEEAGIKDTADAGGLADLARAGAPVE